MKIGGNIIMKLKRVGLTFLASVALASSLAGLSASAQDTVLIGANYELSGDAASYGSVMANGLELAIELVNAEGGVLDGAMLESLILDNQSNLTESASVATRLVSEDIVGIVGPATTGDAQAQIPIVNEAGIPAILPAATGDGITLDDSGNVLDYLFRVCFEDSYQGSAAAAYSSETLGATTAAIITDQALDYSQGLSDAFVTEFEERGGTIVTTESYSSGDNDFSAILTSLLVQEFDVLYIPGYYTEGGLIIQQARQMGITQPIVAGDGFASPTLVELAGAENANDIHYTSHFSTQSEEPIVQEFLAAYEEKFGVEPDAFAALGYDAAMLLIDAVERAGSTDPKAVKDAIAETTEFAGVTGTFAVDENHNPVKPATMITLQNGEITSAELVSAE